VTRVSLPDWPWQTVSRLAEARGVGVWPVGGAVRDLLLGRPVHDWDFAVERDALGLARSVADALDGAYYPLDEERDTGRVVLTARGDVLDLDFAALRGESLEIDLLARDFTVNALAADGAGGVVDVVGGLADIEAERVRAVSDQAFQDDPLRLLRAVRVGANLGFNIEARTADWMRRDVALLAQPSVERVRDEFARLLGVPRAADALQRADEFGLLHYVVPELETLKGVEQSAPHRHDVWRHTLETVDVLDGILAVVTGQGELFELADVPDVVWGDIARTLGQFAGDVAAHLAVEVSGGRDRALILKLAALLHDVGKPATRSVGEDGGVHFYNHEVVGAKTAAARMEELRFSGGEVERVRTIVGAHLRPAHLARAEEVTRRAVYRFFRATSCGGVDVVLLYLADHLATWGPNLKEQRWGRRLEVAETLLAHWFERYEETVCPATLVTGDDLMVELGLEPGPKIGRLLEAVREAQAAGEVGTRADALALAGQVLKGRE
jgi:putative nucleotidyltransferase with HDIG domain